MEHAHTRGQSAALEAVASMLRSSPPHGLLFVGPDSAGKTTLALDLAAALLCQAANPSDRPCRVCRACRMVESGNHPDLHRLGPEGPGGQIVIGGRGGQPRGIRDLVADLALLPVEGGNRVAIIEHAQRMNEDAQSALLKTLEEPPAGVFIVLCADEEERLVPTIRSRVGRVRLGPVSSRDLESFLVERAVADAPTASRLAQLARGRPGVALALALAPDAVSVRGEIARTLVDLTGNGVTQRLTAARDLLARALDAVNALDGPHRSPGGDGPRRRGSREPSPATSSESVGAAEADEAAAAGVPRLAPAERRRAAGFLLDVWRDLTRDILLTRLGELSSIRDPALIDDLSNVAPSLSEAELRSFLTRIAEAGSLLEANIAPELLVDSLAVAWPRRIA